MIQIYLPNNTDFEKNGNDVLNPESCTVTAELGGSWYLDMIHPIDDADKWKNIVKESVVSVPTFMGKNQLFRIDEVDKNDVNVIVKAYPIFFDVADEVFLMDTRPTNKNGQQALDILTNGTKYSGTSNITTVNTAYFIRRNLMDCLNGEDPSFITTWGGEPLYDNFKIILNKRAGGDYGAEIRYGLNMNGISFKEDMSEVVTRIIPVAYNGRTLSTGYVDSPLINNYAKIYAKEIVFEDVKLLEDVSNNEDATNLIICETQKELDVVLTQKCNEQFEMGVDLYKTTIDIDVVAIENTEEFKNFSDIVKIGLGDTVSCYNTRLDISTKARAIKIEWDCNTNSIINVTLGDYETNFLTQWESTINRVSEILTKDGSVIAEKISGLLDGIKTQLKIQNTSAKRVETRAILFEDLDPTSPMYGALAIGTQGLQISNTRTTDGRDWVWTTAFTAKGGYADAIILGKLSDKEGKSYWDLDNSEFQITAINGDNIFRIAKKGGVQLLNSNGNYAVKIEDNHIAIHDYTNDGAEVGRLVAVTYATDTTRAGVALYANPEKYISIGVMDKKGGMYSAIRIMRDEEKEENITTLYGNVDISGEVTNIANTANGTMFSNNSNGGVIVKNGLIESWNIKNATGTLFSNNSAGGIKVGGGIIEDWSLVGYNGVVVVNAVTSLTKLSDGTIEATGTIPKRLVFTNGLLEKVEVVTDINNAWN